MMWLNDLTLDEEELANFFLSCPMGVVKMSQEGGNRRIGQVALEPLAIRQALALLLSRIPSLQFEVNLDPLSFVIRRLLCHSSSWNFMSICSFAVLINSSELS